jgi:branched-chain amino acid transport system substrate-binding protein
VVLFEGVALTRLSILGVVCAGVVFAGCRLILGSLNECSSDNDCAAHGPTVACISNLCVTDPRCTVLGSTDPNAMTWGLVLPYTDNGVPDPNTPNWRDVISLIVDEINPPVEQGVAGRSISIISCNSDNDPTTARAFAQRFLDNGIPAVISDGSSETLNVAAATIPAGALLVTGYSKSPEFTTLAASPQGVRLAWRTMVSDAYVAQVAARYLAGDLGADGGVEGGVGADASAALPHVAVLARNDAYGQGFYAAFAPAYPGPQYAFYFDPSGDTDATALAGATAYAPTVTLFKGFPEDLVRLLNEIEQNQAYAPLFHSTWIFDDQILSPGLFGQLSNPARLNGTLAVFAAAALGYPGHPAFQWLQQEFEQNYGLNPAVTPQVAAYSDAIMLIAVAAGAQATTGGPLDGTHFAEVLGRVSALDSGLVVPLDPPHYSMAVSELAAGNSIEIQGASGPLHFDASTGEAVSDIDIYQIVDGGFSFVRAIAP